MTESPNYYEITALASKYGVCTATNNYFAELYGVDDRTIQRWLAILVDCGFITVTVDKEHGNDRSIRLTHPHDKNVVTPHDNFVTQNNTRDYYPPIVPPKGTRGKSDETNPISEAVSQFQERWNGELCVACPYIAKIIAFNDSRKKQVRARLQEAMKIQAALKVDKDLLEFLFTDIIQYRCSQSDFLQGKVEPSSGHKKFRFDIDHFCRPSFFANLVDGKYSG